MVDYAYCNSCRNRTPVGGITLTLARRIVTRNDRNVQEVHIGESVSQICPDCQMDSETGEIELRSTMPPFLCVETAALSDYLEGMAVGTEVPELEKLPLVCVVCNAVIFLRERYVYVELSLDTTEEHWFCAERKVAVANVCGVCVHKTWGVQLEGGTLNTTPCSTLICPFCAPLRATSSGANGERSGLDPDCGSEKSGYVR